LEKEFYVFAKGITITNCFKELLEMLPDIRAEACVRTPATRPPLNQVRSHSCFHSWTCGRRASRAHLPRGLDNQLGPPAAKTDQQKTKCSSAPTSAMGPMLGGCLPRAPFGCPHSRTYIGACMPVLLLTAPCCLPTPCCAPASARPVAPPSARRPMGTAYAS
jgi:hypothetical protein